MERNPSLTNKRDIINDKIKSVVSLLKTKNMIVINHLIETLYITKEVLLAAINLYLDKKEDYVREIMNDVIDIVINHFEGFDNTMINRLFTELLSDRALYDDNDSCNRCLMKLIDMGATIDRDSYPRIIVLPTQMFFCYISEYELLITIDLILLCVSKKINSKVQDFIFAEWRAQDLAKDNAPLCKIAISSWEHPEQRYFGELMKMIVGHFDCDKIMARMMINHVYYGTLLEIVNFLPDCQHHYELMMFYSVLIIQTRFRGLHHHDQKLDTLFKSNENVKNIFDKIAVQIALNDSEFYKYGFDDLIKYLRQLIDIYAC